MTCCSRDWPRSRGRAIPHHQRTPTAQIRSGTVRHRRAIRFASRAASIAGSGEYQDPASCPPRMRAERPARSAAGCHAPDRAQPAMQTGLCPDRKPARCGRIPQQIGGRSDRGPGPMGRHRHPPLAAALSASNRRAATTGAEASPPLAKTPSRPHLPRPSRRRISRPSITM